MVYQISATDNTQERRLLADSHIYFQQIKLKGLIETSELFEIYASIIYVSSLGRDREALQVFLDCRMQKIIRGAKDENLNGV